MKDLDLAEEEYYTLKQAIAILLKYCIENNAYEGEIEMTNNSDIKRKFEYKFK